MRITPYNKILPLKFLANKDFRNKKDNNIAFDKKAVEVSVQDVQGAYGKVLVNIQQDAGLFNKSVFDLSLSLAGLSDEEFNNLNISQTFKKDNFIAEILSVTKDLPETERQIACKYFGFELYQNEESPLGFSISGYPFISGDKEIIQNADSGVYEAIDKLRPVIIRFLDNNPVVCNNKNIEKELNSLIVFFPELRVLIGKKQHKNHSFDVMKHSLKVMQKIVQNPEFEKLNRQDKELLLVASLFHDIRKTEGKRDPNHAINGAFDTYGITRKLNLPREDRVKLYSLIKNHGWLNYINRTNTSIERWETQKAVAFDMREGNLFDMMKIFTEADLKSTKDSDASFDKHKASFETNSKNIKKHIKFMYQYL